MGAWKSSDGGSIHKIGNSFYAAGMGVVVPAVANVRGVIIWTLSMDANGAEAIIKAGGNNIWRDVVARNWVAPHPVFVPAGLEIAVTGTGIHVSYEIL